MTQTTSRVCFAAVWLVNGLFCKVLDGVPRHRAIVSRILGADHALAWTRAIGLGEMLFAVWIFWGIHGRVSMWVQVVLVAVMNLIEFLLAPDLLLFGRLNSVVALAYICWILWAGAPPQRDVSSASR